MTQREQYDFGDGPLIRFMKNQMGIMDTQAASVLAKTCSHAGTREEAQLVSRLAVKVQAAALADGEAMTMREAITRAKENLRFVRALAGAKGGAW